MKKLLLALPAVAALAAADARQERGRQLIDQTLAALGGNSYQAMADRVESGRAYSFYREQLSGLSRATIYTRYLTRPEPPQPGFFGLRERQAFGKDEDSAVLFNEKGEGWQVTFRGARPMPKALIERFRDSTERNILYILKQRMGEPGMVYEFQRSEIVQNVPVDVVDVTDSENRVVTVYFHQSTHLPVRQVFFRRDPQTKERNEEVTLFSKYRAVSGGIQWPFNVQRERNGEKLFEMYSETVEVNRGLTDDLFTLPARIKILKEAR